MISSNWFFLVAIVTALAGWVYQLGMMSNRLGKVESDARLLEERMRVHHESLDIHTTEEWRTEMRSSFTRLETKVDAIQVRLP